MSKKSPFIPDDFKQPLITALRHTRKSRLHPEAKQNIQDLITKIAQRVAETLGEQPTRQKIVARRIQLEDWVKDVCSDFADTVVDVPNFSHACTSRYGHMRAAYNKQLTDTRDCTTDGIMDEIATEVKNLTGIELYSGDDE